jgi:hypothetical protein
VVGRVGWAIAWFSVSVFAYSVVLVGASGAHQAQAAETMTNQQVVDLVKNGFGEGLIVELVHAAKNKRFDLSTSALIGLKKAGVTDRILTAMLGVVAPPSSETAPSPSASIPRPGRQAGIYFEDEAGLTQLEPAVFSGGKTGGMLASALTAGLVKSQWKAVVRSPRASLRIHTALPVFHFYFESTGSGLGSTAAFFNATSPNEFVLARMDGSRTERSLILGEFGALGSSTGTRSEDTVALKIEKIEPGIYKVTPEFPLTEGEYCFFYAAGASTFVAAGSGKLFDFGVQRK